MTQQNKLTANSRPNPTPLRVLETWFGWLHDQGKTTATIAAYRRGLTHFTRWNALTYATAFDPASIIPRDIRDWKAHQQTIEKAAPATINQRLVAVSRFFAWALHQGIVQTDPTYEVGSLSLPQRQPKSLPKRDLRRLLRAVHAVGDVRDIAIVEVLAGTGLRVGELLALQVDDVLLNERSGTLTVRRGKHGNYRQVPLTADVRLALVAYLEHHPRSDETHAPLWLGTRGDLSHRSSVVRLLDKYAYQAAIDPLTPHQLRHTFATRYLEVNPDDLRGLAALLGHANLNTVMVYTAPRLEDLAERMERIELGG